MGLLLVLVQLLLIAAAAAGRRWSLPLIILKTIAVVAVAPARRHRQLCHGRRRTHQRAGTFRLDLVMMVVLLLELVNGRYQL